MSRVFKKKVLFDKIYYTVPVIHIVTSRQCRNTSYWIQYHQVMIIWRGNRIMVYWTLQIFPPLRCLPTKLRLILGKLLVCPHLHNITFDTNTHSEIDALMWSQLIHGNGSIILVQLTRETLHKHREWAHSIRCIHDRLCHVTGIKTQMSGQTVAQVYMIIIIPVVFEALSNSTNEMKEAWCWYSSLDQLISRLRKHQQRAVHVANTQINSGIREKMYQVLTLPVTLLAYSRVNQVGVS